jgi:hypothetical protein
MRYLVSVNLYNRAGEVIAAQGAVIAPEDLPVPNRASLPWLIEQGLLVAQPDPLPVSLPASKTPKE